MTTLCLGMIRSTSLIDAAKLVGVFGGRCPADAIANRLGSEYPAVVIQLLTRHYAMLHAILWTPASCAVNGFWFWWVRARPWR